MNKDNNKPDWAAMQVKGFHELLDVVEDEFPDASIDMQHLVASNLMINATLFNMLKKVGEIT